MNNNIIPACPGGAFEEDAKMEEYSEGKVLVDGKEYSVWHNPEADTYMLVDEEGNESPIAKENLDKLERII